MNTIFFYNDISPEYFPMARLFGTHKEAMEKQGLSYIARSGDLRFHHTIWTNQLLYLLMESKARNSAWGRRVLGNRLHSMEQEILQGNNLLLMFCGTRTAPVVSLLTLLRNRKTFAACRFIMLFSIGPQEILLEQWSRLRNNPDQGKNAFLSLIRSNCVRPDTMAETFTREFGAENVHVFRRNIFSPVVATPDQAHAERICALLGCEIPLEKPLPTQDGLLSFRSGEARDLLRLCRERRQNAWPPVTPSIADILHQLEPDLWQNENYVSSAEYRNELRSVTNAGNTALAKRYFGAERLFSPPENHGEKELPYAGLMESAVTRFTEKLPLNAVKNIRSRLWVDQDFLNTNERFLASSLDARITSSGMRFPHSCEAAKKSRVTVLTLTYNHRNFIAQTIESVLAQETDFPVEHIIADAGSTDGTQTIIRDYADAFPAIKPVFARKGDGVRALFSRATSPYVALCEGDDYFSDPHKLQTQVAFLDAHPQCSLCFHPVRVIFDGQPGKERIFPENAHLPCGKKQEYTLEDLIRGNFMQTNSVMYRWRFSSGLPGWMHTDITPGDWYWHLLHAEKGKIGFIDRIMSVYRRHAGAVYFLAESDKRKLRYAKGLAELYSYDVINRHFNLAFNTVFCDLAAGVLVDLLEYGTETGKIDVFEQAAEMFPDYARYFLQKTSFRP